MTIEEMKEKRKLLDEEIAKAEYAQKNKQKIDAEIKLIVDRYPNYCAECPMYYQEEYICHNERGVEANCKLGYMDGFDTRDWSGNFSVFHNCKAIVDGKMVLKK